MLGFISSKYCTAVCSNRCAVRHSTWPQHAVQSCTKQPWLSRSLSWWVLHEQGYVSHQDWTAPHRCSRGLPCFAFLLYAFLIDRSCMSDVRWYRVVLVHRLHCSSSVYCMHFWGLCFLITRTSTCMVACIPWWTICHTFMMDCTPHVCWCFMGFNMTLLLVATVLGLQYFSDWYDNIQ